MARARDAERIGTRVDAARADRGEAKAADGARAKGEKGRLMPDITAVMPVRSAWMTMPRALRALARATQSIQIKLLICENEGTDPSVDMCKSAWLTPALNDLGLVDHRVLQQMPCSGASNPHERKQQNLCRMWSLFIAEVKTPYMLMVDADVLIPSRGLYQMLAGMLGSSCLGAYGIDYPVKPGSQKMHDHVPTGCTLYRMEAIREVGEVQSHGCPCRWLDEKLESLGWEVRKVLMVEAEHIE